jgi:hypothetical protein
VAAHRWPRWEEVANTSKRGPRSMHRARLGVMGLTEVARHRRGGGAVVAQWVSGGDDASLRPTATRPGSWGPVKHLGPYLCFGN